MKANATDAPFWDWEDRTCLRCKQSFRAVGAARVCKTCKQIPPSRRARMSTGRPARDLERVTPRERTVLACVELSSEEIAQALGLHRGTVKVILVRLYRRLHIHSRGELLLWAIAHGHHAQPLVSGAPNEANV